jgi:hypothetical protein
MKAVIGWLGQPSRIVDPGDVFVRHHRAIDRDFGGQALNQSSGVNSKEGR